MAEYPWRSATPQPSHAILLPTIRDVLKRRLVGSPNLRLIDIGAGNGALTAALAEDGYAILGVEPSRDGLQHAREAFPHLRFEEGDAYEDLAGRFGPFDAVISCEVIEHLLTPGQFLRRAREMMATTSLLIISTPYHGYLKNLLISAVGKWDFHHHPECEYGHVKFFSRRTLNTLAEEAGLKEVEFHRVGRLPAVAKSMISVFQRSDA